MATKKKSDTVLHCFKGFDKDLKCRDFQYEVGKEYKEEKASLCDCGFHACESPLDVFAYYSPATSRYCSVDLDATGECNSDDSKRVGTKITVGAEIGIPGLAKAHIEYVKSHTTFEHTDPKQATAGDSGAATAGYGGAATAGYGGAATSRGFVCVGAKGVGLVRGNNVKAKGGLGSILVICEENDNDYGIKEWKAAVVDGEAVKADVFYMLKNGEFVEAEQ